MLREKAELSKRQPWIHSRIKGRQDHQTQSDMRNHPKGKNQLKDQNHPTGEQIPVGDQMIDLTHQEGPTGSI